MKYLIITSLYTSITVVTTTQSELLPILFSTAGILLLYWLLSHSLAMRKEIAFLKEENQYFMDSFRNIRTPITLLHTPLKSTYSNNCPDIIKKDLSLAIRNIDCLNDHLTRLMDLKQIATHSKRMNITEHELGNFLKNKISSLKDHAANRHIKLEIQTEFKYASVWIDQSKISPVIEKFIKNIIDHTEYSKKVIIYASLCNKYWKIKVSYTGNENLMKCYKCSGKHLIKQKTESKYYFAKSALCKKLTEICNGEILINNSCHTITLRFPVKPSYENVSERSLVHIEKNIEEEKIDALFHKSSQKRNSSRPVVIMVDSNEEFRSYLETCLSEEYIVRGFENGADALGYIKGEHPDLVICDTVLNGMGGDELSSRLKTSKETSIIPVILYGSHIDADQRSKREASLADTFMHTPFHVEDLKIEISVLIRNSRLLRKAFLHKVFGEHFLQVQPVEIIKEATEGAKNLLINEVKDYILERIENEDLTIDAIASHLRMSRTKFYNRWKTLTGEAPTVFIEAIRMEKAHELLESGKYPVGTIPEMIGLKDVKKLPQQI
jgi:DNA-binding response OmpR family regulator